MDRLIGKGLVERSVTPDSSIRNSTHYKVMHDNATAAIIDLARGCGGGPRGGGPHVAEGHTNKDTIPTTTKDKAINKDNYKDALRIYEVYPRRVGKAAAVKKIQEVIKERGVEFIEDRVKTFAEGWEQRIKVEGPKAAKFIPHPTTWLNQGRYDDDEKEWFPITKKRKIDHSAGF